MMIGYHPFKAQTSRDLQYGICCTEPKFPTEFDEDAQDVIERLLCKRKSERQFLASRLRDHIFFRGIDWKEIETGKSTSPVLQYVRSPMPPTQTMRKSDLIPNDLKKLSRKEDQQFKDFSFVSKTWREMTK
ncbi:putative protein kinase C delta type homolog [Hyperolius riggenbachi]